MVLDFIYPLIIAFILVFISELGDKTQILVLSFSSKLKAFTILIGVALGSFFSHGVAILFGSFLGSIENEIIHISLEVITYMTFMFFGIISLCFKEKNNQSDINKKNNLPHIKLNYVLIIAFSIAIGELGDKTFLASIGLGIQYASSKIPLIMGAIFGMVASDSLAIFLGKLLSKKLSASLIQKFSGILFLLFGFIGLLNFIL